MLAAFAPDAVPAGFRPIGRILAPREGGPTVTLDGAEISGEGFDHFA